MSLFYKQEKEIGRLLGKYFSAADAALEAFGQTMRGYLEGGLSEAFSAGDQRVHRAESRADDLRRQIEKLLYGRSLLPESRGDLLGLLENFDKMPNQAEAVTFMVEIQNIQIPPAYRERFGQLLEVNLEAYRLVRLSVDRLFSDPSTVEETVAPVDAKESESDRLEAGLLRDIFRSELDKGDMILLRDLVGRMGGISDRAEDLAYRLEIISLKKRV